MEFEGEFGCLVEGGWIWIVSVFEGLKMVMGNYNGSRLCGHG